MKDMAKNTRHLKAYHYILEQLELGRTDRNQVYREARDIAALRSVQSVMVLHRRHDRMFKKRVKYDYNGILIDDDVKLKFSELRELLKFNRNEKQIELKGVEVNGFKLESTIKLTFDQFVLFCTESIADDIIRIYKSKQHE